jgi:endoglucanase
MTIVKKIAGAALLSGTIALASAQTVSDDVRLNSIGFLPDYPKTASINIKPGGIMALDIGFSVKDAVTNNAVFTGAAGPVIRNTDTRDSVRVADFSEFKTPGRYYLEVMGVGNSPVFEIGGGVFTEPFRVMMLGFYLWRCGTAVSATYNNQTYSHAACHTSDGRTRYIGGGTTDTRDAVGGWHDAGDYNKYTVNSGAAVALMLKAWEHYGEALDDVDLMAINKSGGIPEYLTEIKWNLDWIAKMQYGAEGQVSHKLSSLSFSSDTTMPENDTLTRYFSKGATESAGSFAGMMALAARIYAPYNKAFADSCLTKARLSYDWLARNTSFAAPDLTGFNTGTYTTGTTSAPYKVNYDSDKRLWAAVELWEATGEAKYLNDFESRAKAADLTSEIEWGEWGGVNGIALLTYLMSEKNGRRQSLVDELKAKLVTVADEIVTNTLTHGYGRAFGTSKYYWGGHGTLTATTYILNMAYAATDDRKYRDAGHEVIGYIFGRNYYGRSFVTGIGRNPPIKPHDRRSQATKKPWPGYLIGGPHKSKGSGLYGAPAALQCDLDAICWKDDERDYWTNEIAINWNASMVYALAAYLPGAEPPKIPTSISGRNITAAKSAAPKIKTSRLVQVRSGRAMDIPAGAKVYSLDGKLVAHRKIGDANMPVIRKNGVFIMKIEERR